MIAAGSLDRRITLLQPTVSRGALGGHSESWGTLATVWGRERPLSGREIFNAQAAGSAVSRAVLIRWRDDVDATLRVQLSDGRIGRIAWVAEVGRCEGLELFCEVVNE